MTLNQTVCCRELAKRIRCHALRMTHLSDSSHIGACLSVADILAVLYGSVMKVNAKAPQWPERDRLVFSKGHASAALYAVLAEVGFFETTLLDSHCQNGSLLIGHVSHHLPGVEVSTGSLGHGLPIACGMALSAKADGIESRTYAILSDGELDEGSNWEAILFAGHRKFDNLIVVVDYNKIQSFGTVKEVLDLEPMASKWLAFGWAVREIDGHDVTAIEDALQRTPFEVDKPSVILAHTTKGKGVSFMEGRLEWHYKSPNDEQLALAIEELESAV
jgi:transketolase